MNISIIVLLVVFVLIAARRIGRLRVAIWQAMGAGALAVLLTGQIAPAAALAAIDPDVMLFLFGMFVVGEALVASGYLYYLAYRVFGRLRSIDALVLGLLFVGGLASAFLMNDTLAIVCTPLALRLAREHGIDPKLLLLTLAFAVTTGSVLSPIGNPQNLLIAVRGEVADPFVTFIEYLALPTLLNLLIAYAALRLYYRRAFHGAVLTHATVEIIDRPLARLARLSLILIVALVLLKITLVALSLQIDFRLSTIALAGALPLLLFSPRRAQLLRDIDWRTLLFFVAMFILMASVWQSGFFQSRLDGLRLDIDALPAVLGVSVALSQLISNVPLVALYLPLVQEAGGGTAALMALAAGSTIAGNLLILGAASNVIIIQRAERHGTTLGFIEFARIGAPLTLVQVLVYWGYLQLVT